MVNVPNPLTAGMRFIQQVGLAAPTASRRSADSPLPTSASPSLQPQAAEKSDAKPEKLNHPSWDSKTQFAINTIRSINSMTEDAEVNLVRMRKVRSYVTLPTNMNVRIAKARVPRRADIVLEQMDADQATGYLKAEWVDYLARAEVSVPFVGPVNLSSLNPLAAHHDSSEDVRENVVLYLHGGGYCLCSRKTHRGLTWKIAKHSKARVFAIDYRLAPEHVFPLALQDAISAFSYLQCHHGVSKIFIAGDSAGAGLALATTLWLRDNGARYNLDQPAGVALMSPWIDLTLSLPSFTTNGKFDLLRTKVLNKTLLNENRSHYYIRDNSFLKNPLVSPLFAEQVDGAPLPPMLIQVGDSERLRDESIAFAAKFSASPIKLEIYEGMVHVFQMLSKFIKVADTAIERLGEFIHRAAIDTENAVDIGSRTVEWVANDSKNGFPVRLMTEAEVTSLVASGIPASDVRDDVAASIYSEHDQNVHEDESDLELPEAHLL